MESSKLNNNPLLPAVLDDHVEPELVVHDGAEAHDADVDVVLVVAHLELGGAPHQLVYPGPVEVEAGPGDLGDGPLGGLEGGALAGRHRGEATALVQPQGVPHDQEALAVDEKCSIRLRKRNNKPNLPIKVPFQDPFSVAKIVIHMQGLHQTAPFPQNKELVWMK